MSTLGKLRKKAKKAVGGVTRQVGRSATQIGQQVGHSAAKVAPYVLGAGGMILGGPALAGLGAGVGTLLDRKYNDDASWKAAMGTGVKAGLGTYGAATGLEALGNWAVPEAMSALGYGNTAPAAAQGWSAPGGNALLNPSTGEVSGMVPKTVGAIAPSTASAAPGLLGDLGGYGQYITPGNLMLGGLGYGLLKGGTGPQDDGGAPAPGTFSPQLPPYMGTGMPQQGMAPQGMAPQGMPGMDSGYMASQGMMNQLMARMQNPQMMQNPMQNPLFTR